MPLFAVTTVNEDRSLLTIAELRAAAGVTDGSKDAALRILGDRVSASIVKACRVAQDGVTPPTLRLEAVSDTFRLKSERDALILSRRPIVAVSAVVEVGTTLAATAYEMDAAAGLLRRLATDAHTTWPCGKILVSYTAGYATVPHDLKLAAAKFVTAETQSDGRDPLLKRKVTEGVSEYEWWVDPSKESVIPAEVMDLLERGGFVNSSIVS